MPKITSIDELQQWVSRCALNNWLGLEVISLTEQGVQIRMPWRDEIVGSPSTGAVHGGILACLIDACAGFAVIAATGESIVAIDLRADYHRPGSRGDLFAHGTIVKHGQTICTSDCRIVDSDQALIASGRVVYFRRKRAAG